jgi:23S rRNA pseudouridine1911/1915/1917 synthase
MPQTEQSFSVLPEEAGVRLDLFLTSKLPEVSRSRVQQLVEQGKVLVNGSAEKSSYKVEEGDEVEVRGRLQRPPLKAFPENIPLDVVYEDASIAVVNKPAGMVVHAGAGVSGEEEGPPAGGGTLVNALLFRFNKLADTGDELRPGIVHRLDKDTSGLMVVAKTDAAHRKLAEQFSSREVHKKYLALVHGRLKQQEGSVTAAIGRDRVHRQRMSTRSAQPRTAVSHYRVLRELETAYGKFSLVEVRIETGRTHQIRVHMASLGHPVVGDTLYGAAAEIQPKSPLTQPVGKIHTKARRDRETSELARRLTEAVRGETITAGKRTKASRVSLPPLALKRNFLHAAELEFTHPGTGKKVRFSSGLPPELDGFLQQLEHPIS